MYKSRHAKVGLNRVCLGLCLLLTLKHPINYEMTYDETTKNKKNLCHSIHVVSPLKSSKQKRLLATT